jgi:hypothetical protein
MLQSTQNKRLQEIEPQSHAKKTRTIRSHCKVERATWDVWAYTGVCRNCEEGFSEHIRIPKLVKPPGHAPFMYDYYACPDLYIRTRYDDNGYYKIVTRMTAAEAVSLDDMFMQ